jgi:hypothetical protein
MKIKKIELLFLFILLQSGLTATQASKLPTFQTSNFPDLAFQSII